MRKRVLYNFILGAGGFFRQQSQGCHCLELLGNLFPLAKHFRLTSAALNILLVDECFTLVPSSRHIIAQLTASYFCHIHPHLETAF